MDITEIINSLGGSTALAAALGFPAEDVGAKRIRAWGLRSSIPAEYWLSIVSYSKEREASVTLEMLAAAHAREPLAS